MKKGLPGTAKGSRHQSQPLKESSGAARRESGEPILRVRFPMRSHTCRHRFLALCASRVFHLAEHSRSPYTWDISGSRFEYRTQIIVAAPVVVLLFIERHE